MPKVSAEYMENKRNMIVECAYRVCLRKPVETVTISDVIAETGMSQGAIYRYYNGLDEILADVAAMLREDYSIIDRVRSFAGDENASFEDNIYKVCDLLAEVMETHLMDIQKFNFDMGVLAINEPERAAKILGEIKAPGNLEFLGKHVFPALYDGAVKQGYHPAATLEEISLFIASAYTGIEKQCIMAACYGTGDTMTDVKPEALFRTLAKTIILLIGGRIDD